ncbi:hypothetical protein C481_20746 [Natrialba asiatica DSM 12278]|uniref:Uncharacterized protein n=1 Tax=Natrialba asiatica (strain ATCC 700177 / DSM 12278 / JCM 9576 / FERM P-10747 / NBRC 102637 / 172P1) TaxID=29540 RepID=M0AIH4_NATA1|nr:hypothetical protein C481_20746 [Natrialba asiatica DSM 12278]
MVHENETRYSLDRVKIEETIERFERFLDAGCEAIYWEGMVVRNLIGRDLAYREGQKALLEVAEAVGPRTSSSRSGVRRWILSSTRSSGPGWSTSSVRRSMSGTSRRGASLDSKAFDVERRST